MNNIQTYQYVSVVCDGSPAARFLARTGNPHSVREAHAYEISYEDPFIKGHRIFGRLVWCQSCAAIARKSGFNLKAEVRFVLKRS